MYSVLIQNQKTMDSFNQFHPLFMDALNSGRIGVCQWFESGMSIETAVPELYSQVNDKEEWRAVIVRVEDEAPMAGFETFPDNPYDFVENIGDDTHMRESDIPLIRLTHMLGGMPSPNVVFKPELVREENKLPKMVYVPSVREEDQEEYRRLSEKYHLSSTPPTEIILISLTQRQDTRVENVSSVWSQHKEIDSSGFWKRNGYPSSCRFCFYELSRQGPVQHVADMFKVWLCVLLLATNDIDASTLQAYKLHRLDVEIDRTKMTENMEATAGKVISARDFITKSIERELEQKINEKTVVPNYKLKAPVVVDLPKKQNFQVTPEEFKLTSSTSTSDMENWEAARERARRAVRDSAITAERALDRTADRMRDYCTYTPDEIMPLDAYQLEDFNTSLGEVRESIFERRRQLPKDSGKDTGRMDELEESVREKLVRRLTRRQAVRMCLICAGASILTGIPGAVLLLTGEPGGWGGVALAAGLGAVLSGAILLVLLLKRGALRAELSDYNGAVGALVLRVAENSSRYSEYMSDLASYAHGQSYLDELSRKNFMKDEAQYFKRNHIAALNAFLAKLKEWTVAFHLPVHLESAELQEDLSFDTAVPPHLNPLYTFNDSGSWPADVNSTGDSVESPFIFVRKLKIEREELYDDAR